jgi:hypothetical protein
MSKKDISRRASTLANRPSKEVDISRFLESADTLPQRYDGKPSTSSRLVFALDATASRQPSWDRACQIQGQMFIAASQLGGLQIQLCYYRGYHEFHYSPWLSNTQTLLQTMTAVQCLGGYTQIERVLNHCIEEQQQNPIQAAIIIADAAEENVDTLCAKAGKLGILGVPLFMFQEGLDPGVRGCFQQMALVSKGAYAAFDENSAQQITDLLSAVATYASGGYDALERLPSSAAKQLLQQLQA